MKTELINEEALLSETDALPYKLIFATISGAHLYGFPSPDSDFDLRGVYVLPVREVVGLDPGKETIEISHVKNGLEIDLVTHDAKKFFSLMLKKNGYVLEQLFSPLIVRTSPEHAELKEIGKLCITKHHYHHYNGFANTQWALFEKTEPKQGKPLLYVFRVLLTGINLMRTGVIEANLPVLNETFCLPYIDELVARKVHGTEHGSPGAIDLDFYRKEFYRLLSLLEEAYGASSVRDSPEGRAALNDLLIRVRLAE